MRNICFAIFVLSFVFIQCKKETEIENVGKVIERTPEEMAALREYAPAFTLPSIDGQEVSLESLKGKYLYVDIWATWCGPCIQQIPAMKELENHFRGQNIEFVSISVDKDADKNKWKKMIQDKQMSGLQLFAGKKGSFNKDYKVSTIPKFLIIGKEGEIIDDNAPRPMDYRTGGLNQELISMINNLLKQ